MIINICENISLLKHVHCGMFNIFLCADDEMAIIIKNVSGARRSSISLTQHVTRAHIESSRHIYASHE